MRKSQIHKLDHRQTLRPFDFNFDLSGTFDPRTILKQKLRFRTIIKYWKWQLKFKIGLNIKNLSKNEKNSKLKFQMKIEIEIDRY